MVRQDKLTPSEVVEQLDKYIIGQSEAKRAVAIAFRNRWRRLKVEDDAMRAEITPKNILMVGPTGVGKTEISRRLSKLAYSPFIKTEATKFTEVGYVGRDVETIIRDLMDISYSMAEETAMKAIRPTAKVLAISDVIDALNPQDESERTKYELHVAEGVLDDDEVEIGTAFEPTNSKQIGMDIAGNNLMPMHIEELTKNIQSAMNSMAAQPKAGTKQKLTVARALEHFERVHIEKLIDRDEVKELAIKMAEQSGIVFIDEIDKIAGSDNSNRYDVSRQGVQRDLLPLIEGTTVQTKYGNVETDHMLFIGSGAFHYNTPNDLIPEMQGRLPVRVNLKPLTIKDFIKILSKTQHCLVNQYKALLETEGLTVEFSKDGIKRIAELAFLINSRQENIGARRLHTLMEKLLDDIAFRANEMVGEKHTFTKKQVDDAISALSDDETASRIFL